MIKSIKKGIKAIVKFVLTCLAVLLGVLAVTIIMISIPADPCVAADWENTEPDVIAECKIINSERAVKAKVKAEADAIRAKSNAVQAAKETREYQLIYMKVNTERHLKKTLKDPDSYQHINTYYLNKDGTTKITIEYRARNGFGGMAVGTYSRVFTNK